MQNIESTELLFDLSKPGMRCVKLPSCDVEQQPIESLLPSSAIASHDPPLPEVSEPVLCRHFTNLSTRNFSVDTHFYPLGSCTMKYNPKRNERLASLPGLVNLHPYSPDETVQGQLQMLYEQQQMLAEIAGLPAVCLQPSAGAHGEMTALFVAAAYFKDMGQSDRINVLVPDGAHGTNPASAAMAGLKTIEVKSTPGGMVDIDDLQAKLDDKTAVFMITNPNTLGLFERNIKQICDLVHESGGLVYLDGANMNAILGITRPGDFGADMMHYNPHKTFSGPHGGGGPGAGPIAVAAQLEPYLPVPRVVKEVVDESNAVYKLDFDHEKTIGRVRSFLGNVGVLNRMYCYIMTHGGDGLRRVSEQAVLNANYLLSRVRHFLHVPHGERCMHEFVASASVLKSERKISAMDVAKRLIDYGFHAPTVYFPLIVREALMIEPTETESRETLDRFIEALFRITEEGTELLQESPHSTSVSRPDEVQAARKPVLKAADPKAIG